MGSEQDERNRCPLFGRQRPQSRRSEASGLIGGAMPSGGPEPLVGSQAPLAPVVQGSGELRVGHLARVGLIDEAARGREGVAHNLIGGSFVVEDDRGHQRQRFAVAAAQLETKDPLALPRRSTLMGGRSYTMNRHGYPGAVRKAMSVGRRGLELLNENGSEAAELPHPPARKCVEWRPVTARSWPGSPDVHPELGDLASWVVVSRSMRRGPHAMLERRATRSLARICSTR